MLLQLGFQSIAFAVLTQTYAINQRFRPSSPRVDRFFEYFTLERGAMLGIMGMGLGSVAILAALAKWFQASFGYLDYASTMRLVIPGATLIVLGLSTILNSFLCSMLGLNRRYSIGPIGTRSSGL
jgi:hypothetical protein